MAPDPLTIAITTCRSDPRVDWILDDLESQIALGDEIELIVIDFYGRSPAELGIVARPWLVNVTATQPKPTIWQGPHRVTSEDWWAAANARNTAIVLCRTEYIAMIDDRGRLGPAWLDVVKAGVIARSSVLAGVYDRHDTNGRVRLDSRRRTAPRGKADCGGSWLYGANIALPLAWALDVNGFEEGADGLSGEDYVFGFMLENSGRRIDFSTRMLISQHRSSEHLGTFVRADKSGAPYGKLLVARERWRRSKRTEFTPDLIELRARIARGEPWPIPDPHGDHRDWYTGKAVSALTAADLR